MLCIHFEGRINKICQTEDEKKRKITLLFGLRIGRVGLPFTEMEKIREGKACLLVCWGDGENQEFIFGLVKVVIPIKFPTGNVKSAIECMNSYSRREV